jgi:hypothetical protein
VTQVYIYHYAESQVDAPRIPKVIHHFQGDHRRGYLVMEHLKLRGSSPPDLPERIAEALKWLSGVPAPSNHVIGPLGGGRIRHRFFKDDEAPLLFSSIEALERYMEKVHPCLYLLKHPLTCNLGQGRTRLSSLSRRPVKPVSISGERLIFTQSDMDTSNFGVDEDGNTVLLDFGQIGLLPESFVMYIMCSGTSFTASVAKSLGWSGSFNLTSMAVSSGCLWKTSDTTLGASTCA